jgi:hypothetical protein
VALGKAMDAAGITGKYARASILGIAMGESECVPQVEAYNYPNPTYLKRVFSFLTDAEAELAKDVAVLFVPVTVKV